MGSHIVGSVGVGVMEASCQWCNISGDAITPLPPLPRALNPTDLWHYRC